jgi:hypothetical protein
MSQGLSGEARSRNAANLQVCVILAWCQQHGALVLLRKALDCIHRWAEVSTADLLKYDKRLSTNE